MAPPVSITRAYLEQIAFPNMFAATSAFSRTTHTRCGVRCCSHSWRCGGGSSALHRYCRATVRRLLVPRALFCKQQQSPVKTVVKLSYVVQNRISYTDRIVAVPLSKSPYRSFTHATTSPTNLSDFVVKLSQYITKLRHATHVVFSSRSC